MSIQALLPPEIKNGTAVDEGGYIYVIEFSNGVIKVGSSRNPQSRRRQHESDAGAFGLRMTSYWLSDRHSGYLTSEKTLIMYAKSRAGAQLRREYFRHVSLIDLIQTAEEIASSNGELGVEIIASHSPAIPLSRIREMYPQLHLREIHTKCIYGEIVSAVVDQEFCLSLDAIAELVRAHAAASPPRSLRHRMGRRSA